MKLKKLKLNELADAELNEREMCRILGGGEPGCCQCGCHYANSGGSSSSSNNSANDAGGQTSDPGQQPCCPEDTDNGYTRPVLGDICHDNQTWVQESTCMR